MSDRTPMWWIELGAGVRYEIHGSPGKGAGVCTVYPDGHSAFATRDDTEDNRREAADQGYVYGSEPVWQSLRDHEVLHTLVSRALLGRESPVLRHEAGAEPCRYALRLYEEALVISFQCWMNTRCVDPVLVPHIAALPVIEAQMLSLLCPDLKAAA